MTASSFRILGSARATALAVFGIWTLYGGLVLSQVLLSQPSGTRPPWKPYGPFLLFMGAAWTWAAFTPLIAFLVRRIRPSLQRPHTLLVHLAAFALIHGALTIVDGYSFYFISHRLPDWSVSLYLRSIAESGVLYAAVALAVATLDHARLARSRAIRAAELEADLTRARLETLRRQLQPHFLFNTLNTISDLIEVDPPRAGAMVTQLGELLRRSLQEQEAQLVSLDAELEFVTLYIAIEKVRFEGWLRAQEDIEPASRLMAVPPMILQPLVENAIRHGISPSQRAGTVRISSRLAGDRLQLEVCDDGVGFAGGDENSWGIGLSTTQERLQHTFGGDARLVIESLPTDGTRVLIDLPALRFPAKLQAV